MIALLDLYSSPEEKASFQKKEDARRMVSSVVDAIKPLPKEEKVVEPAPDKQGKMMRKMMELMVAGFSDLTQAVVSKLEEIKAANGQSDYAMTIQDMAKTLAAGLGQVKKSVDDKPVPTWKFPQYLYSGLRDTQFKPINPAIDAFGIGDFDQTVLSYTGSNLTGVVYKLATRTVATLTLTYDGSDNLINVIKS
jgi:hypothetical protein